MRRVGPRHEFVEFAREVAIYDLHEDIGHVGPRIDAIELAGLDERGNDGPILGPAVRVGEECILAIERHHPFILPMSGSSWKSITGGIRILAARLLSVVSSSEQLGNFF